VPQHGQIVKHEVATDESESDAFRQAPSGNDGWLWAKIDQWRELYCLSHRGLDGEHYISTVRPNFVKGPDPSKIQFAKAGGLSFPICCCVAKKDHFLAATTCPVVSVSPLAPAFNHAVIFRTLTS
jgi:hypothetical protein